MRVTTSVYSIQAALGDLWPSFCETFEKENGREITSCNWGWHWILGELDVPMPKSAAALAKSDPCQHLAIGLSRGKYDLKLTGKPEAGRVWVSGVLPGSVAPMEVALALKKRATPVIGDKWAGVMVDLYMPMHQKHPGLAEHAVVGGLRRETGQVVCFLSDRPDPNAAPFWQVYEFHPSRRVAQALLTMVDRAGQKDFRMTGIGQELAVREFSGVKLSDDEILAALSGVKKFVWKTDPGTQPVQVPPNARKFKLGEELSLHESQNMPAEALIGALGDMLRR